MRISSIFFCLCVMTSAPTIARENPQEERSDARGTPDEIALVDPADSKVICKKQEVTGSFVRSRKVCRTKAEWNRITQDMQRQVQEYTDHGRGGSRGN